VVAQEALDAALAALRHRDLSAAELGRRLASRGFDEREREEALATLMRTGLVDDRRYAEGRAGALASRGAGDTMVRQDLRAAGIAEDIVDVALEALDPETIRARRIVDRRGPGPRTARYLSGKGFSEEVVADVAAERAFASDNRDELG
jgi:regulatory protein